MSIWREGDSSLTARQCAIIQIFMAAVLWSLGGILIKLVGWHPIAISGMRSAIAAVVLRLFIGKRRISLNLHQLVTAVDYAAIVILFVTATKLTTAANAILLQYTAPIYTAIFGSWLLRERVSPRDWITIGLVLGGVGLFFFDKLSAGGMAGNICAVVSGIAFGLMPVLMRMSNHRSPIEAVFLGNVIAALIGIPFMFESRPTAGSWAGLLLLGTVQLAIPYILYSKAISRIRALEAVLITSVEPILNPLLVLLFLGESPGRFALLGGVIVVASVTVNLVKKTVRK